MPRKKLKVDETNEKAGEASENSEEEENQLAPVQIIFEDMFWEKIWKLESELSEKLMQVNFKSDKEIAAVYNPLQYASELHINYLKKFLKRAPKVLFLGMNPGPFGMCQTSVPFGHVPTVKNWMKLTGNVQKPTIELKSRPIEGLNFEREEPSGKRFWGLIEELCKEPENFFDNCFVHNICPLAFLHVKNGRNITPLEIKGNAKAELNSICLSYLAEMIAVFNPQMIVNIGTYCSDQVKNLQKKKLISDSIECKLLPHPSPRALNNHNWVEKARQWMIDNDMMKYFKKT